MELFDYKKKKKPSKFVSKMIKLKVDELYRSDRQTPFKKNQLKLLTRFLSKKNWQCKYAFWKQKRKNGLYLLFIIDHSPGRGRKCAMDHSIEVVGTRKLSDLEHEEVCANFGCVNRVMQSWYYKSPDEIAKEDLKYGVKTPQSILDKFEFNKYLWNSH